MAVPCLEYRRIETPHLIHGHAPNRKQHLIMSEDHFVKPGELLDR
jgi:hypothetical protein